MSKQFKIQFLGSEHICLQKQNNSITERIDNCNRFISLVASKDREFFKRKDNGNIARFELQNDKLVYIDHYSEEPIFKTHKQNKCDWKGLFNGGGTLRDILMYMSIYIKSGIPFLYRNLLIDNWGYEATSIDEIKTIGIKLGIITEENRYMFYSYRDEISEFLEYVDTVKMPKDKCICVFPKTGNDTPYWVGEFNFIYTRIR